MRSINTILFIFIFLNLLSFESRGQIPAKPHLTLTQFASGFTRPTDIKNCGDSRLFVLQQRGVISIVDSLGNINSTPFLDITKKVNSAGNEEGLLGLAFSPDYANDGIFYIDYTNHRGPSGNCVISRFHRSSVNPFIADTTEEKLIEIYHPYTNHNGGDLAFGIDGYLYYGVGDGGNGGDPGNRAQSLDSLPGKLYRLDVSNPGPYRIPATNPFVNTPNARHEIWAYGLRNPWRWSFDRLTHDLWIGDVGQNTWEEIDFQPANDPGGENYGWHCWEGDVKYSACDPPNVTFPVYSYNHSAGNCSVTGGYIYRGIQYGDLFGWYLLTDYCSGRFVAIHSKATSGWWIDTLTVTPVSPTGDLDAFGEDMYGELYIAGNTSGKIWKIGTESCAPVAFITNPDSALSCGSILLKSMQGNATNLSYQWAQNGNIIPGATNNTFLATFNGDYTVSVTKGICSSLSNSVNVNVNYCTNTTEIKNDYNVSIYPNPNTAGFFIDIKSQTGNKAEFRITDILGRDYSVFQHYIQKGENHIAINTIPETSGIYLLIINTSNAQIIKKFLVSK